MSYFYILLTLLSGGIFGLLFMALKIPNGLRIGAMLGAAVLSIVFHLAYMPPQTRFLVQAIAGALIGCSMEQSDLMRLPRVIKPTLIMLISFLILNIFAGVLIHRVSPLDWATSFMGLIPGGVTEAPIVAADMGADVPKVALMQLARYTLGIAVFPPMILAWDQFVEKTKNPNPDSPPAGTVVRRRQAPSKPLRAFLCTMAAAMTFGFIGSMARIPAGVFLFAIIAVLALKLKFNFAVIPPWAKRFAQLISGCYIGSAITMNDVRGFRFLALPLVIITGGYIINSFITGKILSRVCGFSRKEGMLTTTPAGASDIALSSSDIGVENTDIIIIQIFRAIITMTVFPQIINVLLVFLS
ncbi:MAG: AbrB family transcriptional regulator [Treponema sp.]|jgi:membrane AbrB-like protein|nr:AbrB family transcriptional regulator [Treponema sp.]